MRMSSSTTSSSPLSLFARLTHLRLSFSESERPLIVNRIVRSVWRGESRVARLSMNNCILMDERYFTEISSSLMRNEYLTHLSLVFVDLHSSIPLIALSPVLEHLRIRVRNVAPTWSNSTVRFLERQQWSSRVKSLHLTAHETVVDPRCLWRYIRFFAASLERLAGDAHLIQGYLMDNRQSFEGCLLRHLPKLKHVDFCMHTGPGSYEYES